MNTLKQQPPLTPKDPGFWDEQRKKLPNPP
jgi:hypothetical protein